MSAAPAAIYPVEPKAVANPPAKAPRGAALADCLTVWPLFTRKERKRFRSMLKQLERAR